MINYRFFAPALFLLFSTTVQSVDIDHTKIEPPEVSAERYGLNGEDWTRYEEVMKGEGQYHWSHLDPVWVLAIYAESDADRQRYASLAAKQEYERTRKLLLFKDAYVAAFQDMYGDVPIMDLEGFESRYRKRQMATAINSDNRSTPTIKRPVDTDGDRMVLFMSTNGCPNCDALFMRLSNQQTPGVLLDLHFIGDSESAIMSWAERMGIDPSDIENGHITLNNGSAMYAQYGNPSLPAAYYYDASADEVLSIREDAK